MNNGDPSEYEFATSQALLDYATHRLLWSWYSRDRERRNANPDERSQLGEDGPDTGGFRSDEFKT